jgi:LPXTG-site transpeptidase (sortase) family protein
MTFRRALSAVFVLAGAALIAAAVLHYARGARAQQEGAEALRRSAAQGYTTVSAPTASAPTVPTPAEQPPARREDLPVSGYGRPGPDYPTGEPLAHLRIPAARMDWVVFAGADDATLEKGPGHVPGTAIPGQDGSYENCVITAHRDSHFRNLGWLRRGHMIELEAPSSGVRRYRVVSREIVTPKTVRVLAPTKKPRLTLITCYPFTYIGPAPKRLVIVAEPIATPRTRTASAAAR